jgi:hypothetical protein
VKAGARSRDHARGNFRTAGAWALRGAGCPPGGLQTLRARQRPDLARVGGRTRVVKWPLDQVPSSGVLIARGPLPPSAADRARPGPRRRLPIRARAGRRGRRAPAGPPPCRRPGVRGRSGPPIARPRTGRKAPPERSANGPQTLTGWDSIRFMEATALRWIKVSLPTPSRYRCGGSWCVGFSRLRRSISGMCGCMLITF